MIAPKSSPCKDRSKLCKVVRNCVRLVVALVLLVACIVVFLASHGVPGSILRKIERSASDQNFAVEIGSIHLSLHGWRASNVRVFSRYPDDLDPIFMAREMTFRRIRFSAESRPQERIVRINAHGIRLSPSTQWCIGLDKESSLRKVDQVTASIAMSPKTMRILDGLFVWRGIRFNIDGEFLLPEGPSTEGPAEALPSYLPVTVDPSFQKSLERTLNALELSESAEFDLDFLCDSNDPLNSRCTLSASTGEVEFRGVGFSHTVVELEYDRMLLGIEKVAVQRDNEEFSLRGRYDVATHETELWLNNEISSKELFLLLPGAVLAWMGADEVRPAAFPHANLHFGPASLTKLLNRVDGTFALQDLEYRGLDIASLAGRVNRTGSRLDLSGLQGVVRDVPDRALDLGSCMKGGAVSGNAFWDSASGQFGIASESELDPNLLVGPLSPVRIATNVIDRFKFDRKPPRVWFELGASYYDWESLYISIRAVSEEMRLHDVPFSSMTGTGIYQRGVLSLESVVAQQGIDFLKGSGALDFRRDLASFDVAGSINPRSIEDVVYPGMAIFSKGIVVSGPTKISARGKVNWRTMRDTEFRADVEAQKVQLPFAILDRFSASVSGDGPLLTVSNAVFGIYGGEGRGKLSLRLDPATNGMPYTIDAIIGNADLQKCLAYLYPDASHQATGDLSGKLQAESDFTRSFFNTANGSGYVKIRHGQLADLPLFSGFSVVMRKMIPSFRFFSINSLYGDYQLRNGVIFSENAYFDGDVLSAKGKGRYSQSGGFDAYVQAQVMSDNNFSKIFRFFTDPILKFFEMKLEGPLDNPQWKLEPFSSAGSGKRPSD